jgi:non-heme chloroperoxidase
MPFIETQDGTDLYVKQWGDGPPVVLIHGWPLSADSWDYQMQALADAGFRAIAYDRRGFGRSDQPGDGYDYDTLSDDLADVLEAADATDDVTLVGFSMGGGEVARYMSRHGGAGVSRVALIASVVPYLLKTDDNPDGVPQSTFDEMTEQMESDRAAFFTSFFKQFYGEGFLIRPVSQEVLDWSRNTAMMAGLRGTLACANAFATTDFRADLPSITVPTLVIHGTSDKNVPIDPTAREVIKALPQAQIIEYDGEPHGILATAQDRVCADLLAFLGQDRSALFGSATADDMGERPDLTTPVGML